MMKSSFLIQTEDNQLRKLPWHIWRFFRDYHQGEVGLSAIEFEPGSQVKNSAKQVRILAILGDSTGIDVEADRSLLKSLPDAKTVFLVEPKRQELDEQLWDKQGWDILFFAGHSSSTDGETGYIYINSTERLTIPQLKNALSKAIKRGLALAIFNSCDGLGLAQQLDDLHISQIIVMREKVPDRVAQEFLKHFLSSFAEGKSFYLAVREARDQLQGLESDFPGASWLPVICQNPAQEPPTWQQLRDKTPGDKPIHPALRLPKLTLKTVFIVSFIVTSLVMGMRQLGILQPLELWAFDQLLQRRPDEGPDPRLLLVTVTEKDVQNQNPQQRRGASLSDRTLTQLLNKLQRYQPQVIGWDIYHDFPVEPNYTDLKNHIKHNSRLISVCEVGGGNENAGTRQPPEIPGDRFGFSDFPVDSDDVIRRQLLGMETNTNSFCQTDISFSFRVAQSFLAGRGIQYKRTSGDLQIGKVVFNKLKSGSGGYHHIDALGYQVMLNYRSSHKVAEQITLGKILSNSLDHKLPNLVNNRIVLIGTIAPSFKDYSATPYSTGQPNQKMAGVIIQAHAVSQILSAVLDRRPLLWWLPDWGVTLWVWGWSLVGGMFVLYKRSLRSLVLAIGSTLIVLPGFCFIFLLKGGWMPLIPSALAVAMSGGSIMAYSISQRGQQNYLDSQS